MQVMLLVTNQMRPIPSDIEVLEDYGEEVVVNTNGQLLARGDVVCVKTSENAFRSWIGEKSIWIGNGMIGFNLKKLTPKEG